MHVGHMVALRGSMVADQCASLPTHLSPQCGPEYKALVNEPERSPAF